jgi:phage tail sheath gpL-like
MTTISQPNVTISKVPASSAVANAEQKILFVGQKLAAGTATAGALVQNIPNDGSEDTLFGQGSMLALMIKAAKLINNISRFDVIPLSDAGAGVAASGTIVFAAVTPSAGTINISVGSKINNTYSIAVTAASTATTLGDALVAAITADTKSPVTAVNTTGSVAITAKHKGPDGNKIPLFVSGSVSGVTVTLTALTTGATAPTLTNIFSVLGDERYQTVVFPSSYTYDFVVKDFLDTRFNVDNDQLQGVAICSLTDTLANLKTAGNSQNSPSLVIIGDKLETAGTHKGPSIVELEYVKAAQVAAFRALKLTDGTELSRYIVTTDGPLDYFGGTHMASFPYFNTPFYNLPLIPQGYGFTKTEIEELQAAGITVLGNNKTRTNVLLGEVVTTYKTDAAGNADETWKYLEYVDTASAGSEYMFNNLKKDSVQSRLTEGDLIPGYSMINEAKAKALFMKYYGILSGTSYLIFEAGDDAVKSFKDSLVIAIDKATGKITAICKPTIVTQARNIQVTMQIALTI